MKREVEVERYLEELILKKEGEGGYRGEKENMEDRKVKKVNKKKW